ncbi:MAG: ATP-binding protein [Clostridia bacterium]|nr:ATP-binding protein [Clostridia bacterium]
MPYNKEIYEKAQEIIEQRRKDAENKNSAIIRLFETMEPEYSALKKEMINSVKEAVKAIDMSPEKAAEFIQQQKIRNLTAQQNIKLLLKKHSLSENYLEIKYFCPECEDTGFKDGKLCECHIKLLKDLAFEEAGKKSPLKFCRFEDFRLDYYSDKAPSKNELSPREKMEEIYSFCKEYTASFDTSSQSVLMQGQTGLGKTHLSLSIAGEVIKKGYSVLYNSAQNIFNTLQKERFGKSDTGGAFEAMVLECDLLVIDDLGAEFFTQFTNAALYNIINTRINMCLPTIISTNLTLSEIENIYSTRISSRLIGEYAVLNFSGNDIRQIKSENNQ